MKKTKKDIQFLFLASLISLLGFQRASFSSDDLDVQSTRESKVGADIASGNDRFGTARVFGDVGINSTWAIQASFQGTRNDAKSKSQELLIGTDAKFTRHFLGRAQLMWRREPGSIKGMGLSPGASYTVSSLWRGDLKTIVSLDLSWARFAQSGSYLAENSLGRGAVGQLGASLNIRQEIMDIWWVSFGAKGYRYGEGSSQLNSAVSKRRLLNFASGSFYPGFARNQFSVETDVKVLPWMRPSLSYITTEDVTSSRTDSMVAMVDFSFLQHWNLQPLLTYSKTRNTTGSDMVFALEGSFHW